MFTPAVKASPFDIAYFNVFNNYTDWAEGFTNYLTSSRGQSIEAEWQQIHRCENSLWRGQQMIPPAVN